MTNRTWLVVSLLLLSVCPAWGGKLGPKDGRDLPPADLGRIAIGSKAPDFTLEDAEGNPYTLSGFRGKQVVLVFFRGGW